jgi:KipI family sensor histidine kinase inhibitor
MLDKRLVLPRRESPRKRVPAGSVAIAEAQTGVYPSETPGGWHLIGSTAARMFDAGRNPPALLSAGDTVRFEISK